MHASGVQPLAESFVILAYVPSMLRKTPDVVVVLDLWAHFEVVVEADALA